MGPYRLLKEIPIGDKLTLVQTLKTAPRARTMTLDPKTHKLYTATATIEPPPPGATGAAARGRVVPDTFKVLVYEMVK